MIFSIPFLLITFCVYGFVPELRNLHGKSLMCYVLGLMVLYICLSIVQLDSGSLEVTKFACSFVGHLIYSSVFLCFFWLNVMCYDIWSTFKSGIRGRGSDRRRFLLYCLYAFGVPLLITGIIILIDLNEFVPRHLKPAIGTNSCMVQNSRMVQMIYVYIPISIILIINIVFYSITAYKIYRVRKETSVVRKGDSQKHSKTDNDKDR